jgi:molecular chaperone GrpE
VTAPFERDPGSEAESDGPVIRDKRRIDPVTGQVREQLAESAPDEPFPHDDESVTAPHGDEIGQTLEERTADLQRVTAEYANYRKRVERDRQAVVEQALAGVLITLLPVLDDIDRARDHGELEGGVKSIADNLETTLTRLGLERFGTVGESFDPTVHEAMTHAHRDDVTEPTCAEIYQPGYRLGERVLRPARVAVVDPPEPDTATESAADTA